MTLQSQMDDMVGRPFVVIPGYTNEHVVAGETFDGRKIRVGGVMQVWNAMLLMDACEGAGFFLRHAGEFERAHLEVAERIYGMSAADAVNHWLTLPKGKKGDPLTEWPGRVS